MINFTEIRMFFRRLRKTLEQMWNCRYYMKTYYPDDPIVKQFPVGKKIDFMYGSVRAEGYVIGYRVYEDEDGGFKLLEIDLTKPEPYNKLTSVFVNEEAVIT